MRCEVWRCIVLEVCCVEGLHWDGQTHSCPLCTTLLRSVKGSVVGLCTSDSSCQHLPREGEGQRTGHMRPISD